ncbi:Scramblase-domain-containing protein [Venturia nashicola]|uniref:Scramblase-domain-containing protein n=1 Tax=Venturia nashicola TaxID=86259 RepID=A0A4Z1PD36_9PEZI|nr:Scramblase-domain-containing protein [Venturia nashicola]TLD35845.1 Scramblase-domain-containing protein [Venturia nashicola]
MNRSSRLSRIVLARTQIRSVSSRGAPTRGPRNTVPRPPLPERREIPRRAPQEPSNETSKLPGQQQDAPNEHVEKVQEEATGEQSKVEAVSGALHEASELGENPLDSPVHMPEDTHGVLKKSHPAMAILHNSSIVIQRQLEMMNVLLGFEQANRYVIMDPQGNHIGYLAEQDHGIGSTMKRQAFKTHRSFTTHVFDKNEKEVLRIHRPFAWINSRIRIYDAVNADENVAPSTSKALEGVSVPAALGESQAQMSPLALEEMRVIGETHQQWAPLRRKYNMFLHRQSEDLPQQEDAPRLTSGDLPLSNSTALQTVDEKHPDGVMVQWAHCDEPFLSWDFSLKSEDGKLIGSVNRNFAGFGREIFTDTGVYALRMDSAGLTEEPKHIISQTGQSEDRHVGMTLDQRAVMLATAVSIDFDYFSRHSGGVTGGGFMPLWFPGMGGGAAEAGAAEAGAVGAAGETGVAGEVAGAARGVGSAAGAEGAITGAGTMAGYEAMQHARGGRGDDASPGSADDASPTSSNWADDNPPQSSQDTWGTGNDPWAGGNSGGGWNDNGVPPQVPPGGSGGGGGDGEGFSFWDLFGGDD